MKLVDIVGNRYGRLIVEKFSHAQKGFKYWKCRCDCGNFVNVTSSSLLTGNTKSCGCLRAELLRKRTLKYENREYASFLHLYNAYRRGAKRRGITFSLTVEDFIELCKEDCVYCGASPEKREYWNGRVSIESSGVDRINNNIGYIKENCVTCCTWCNFAKRELSMKDFINHCKKVAERFS